MRITIDRDGGGADQLDLDLAFDSFTAREMVRVREVIGDVELVASPETMLAMVWAKLVNTPYRDIPLDAIDFDMSELAAAATTDEEREWTNPQATDGGSNAAVVTQTDPVVIPMETTTGTVEAEVDIGQQ